MIETTLKGSKKMGHDAGVNSGKFRGLGHSSIY